MSPRTLQFGQSLTHFFLLGPGGGGGSVGYKKIKNKCESTAVYLYATSPTYFSEY